MPLVKRFRLNDVVSSFSELGPTMQDGGYSWAILFGVISIQMTVPSVFSMYGVILGHLADQNASNFDSWAEKIILTPILFSAFWNFTDPWSRAVVELASVPRLVGVIGVALLSIGVVASSYLATGGVGAYLASLSAGAIMGIGGSFVVVQSETVLYEHFRRKLPLALTTKNVASSLGLALMPGLARLLLLEVRARTALLLVTLLFVPAALGALALRSPTRYGPLVSPLEEDEEEPEVENNGQDNGFRILRFWFAAVAKVAGEGQALLFWTLLPTICVTRAASDWWLVLPVAAGLATLLPSFATYCLSTGTARRRKLLRAAASWLGCAVSIGLTYFTDYRGLVVLALVGGLGIGCSSTCRDSASINALVSRRISRTRVGFAAVVGSSISMLCFVHGINSCFRIVAVLEFVGGFYWIFSSTDRGTTHEDL